MPLDIAADTTLFEPYRMGPYLLKNRIAMAPLTRSRATSDGVPKAMQAVYYGQRASAGLIVSEATNISAEGRGYAWTPGIWNDEQIAGWRPVTEAVHARGGRIFCQLWHVGRVSHPSLQPGGALPVAPSAVKPAGRAFTEQGFVPFVTPRALELEELPGIVEQYRVATRAALAAGFDGVEIHGANGYLLDQFLRTRTNLRTDRYGGSIENRARLLLEVVEAVTRIAGGARTGLRLSPTSPANDVTQTYEEPLFRYVVERLNAFELVYLHLVEGVTQGSRTPPGGFDLQLLRRQFRGTYLANNGYDRKLARETVAAGRADLIAFGRPFIANPDLVSRLKLGKPLAQPNRATFYGGGSAGYTDYPTAG